VAATSPAAPIAVVAGSYSTTAAIASNTVALRSGHDFDRFHSRHRVFRNVVWVWVYGPDYYAYGGDFYWLRQQELATGSPYWWLRYNACMGYY
jgi:hypothetical protein